MNGPPKNNAAPSDSTASVGEDYGAAWPRLAAGSLLGFHRDTLCAALCHELFRNDDCQHAAFEVRLRCIHVNVVRRGYAPLDAPEASFAQDIATLLDSTIGPFLTADD
jgi:hypothetical protein